MPNHSADTLSLFQAASETLVNQAQMPVLDYSELLFRFIINFVSAIVLIRFIYYSRYKNSNYVFNFLIFNALIFIICLLLSTATLQIGFAFGLFALFSIMRFRTVSIPLKEMGYFFAALALGAINALSYVGDFYIILISCNLFILILTFALDRIIPLSHENVQSIIYERIELIVPERRDELIADLKKRTGLPIHRVDVGQINFLRDIARINAYYYSSEVNNSYETAQMLKEKDDSDD